MITKDAVGEGKKLATIPTQADIGFPVRVHWAYDVGPDRPLSSVNKFVVHDTEGNMGSDEPVLANNDDNIASTHALIAPSGELVFMVSLTQTAWTPGNDTVAKQSINVEMSGFQSKGYTDAQYKSMANFFKWCIAQGCPIPAEYVAKSGKPGILGHQDVANPFQPGKFGGASGHTDPGPLFQWGRFVALCKEGNVVPDYDPCMDYFNSHGGEAVFGKPIGGQHGSVPGAVEREFEFCHMYLDKATNQIIAQMKDRTNPQGKDVGPGIYSKCKEHGLKLITNEQYFLPAANQSSLGKMSRAWAQDAKGVTVLIMASELVEKAEPGKDTPWKVEVYELV
jgi:hypothetical protein